jgi:hypothetical protein
MRAFSVHLKSISIAFLITGLLLISCTKKSTENPTPVASVEVSGPGQVVVKELKTSAPKDKVIQGVMRVFEQADAIHREAWWVVGGERRASGKSPFGKVQRALMADQNIKLSNKSFFRCDRYLVKRDILSPTGIPQNVEIFEKCSEKTAAKKIADFSLAKAGELKVTFVAENMEEVLGTGATVLLRLIECQLNYNEQDQLTLFRCKSWAQDRGQNQVVRLDTYEYQKNKSSLLKLQGKVYENLTELRKIDVSIPLEGKIKVTETELYAPEEAPTPTPTPSPTPVATAKPSPTPSGVDPDVLEAQKRRIHERAMHGLPPHETPEEAAARQQQEGGGEQQAPEPEGPPGVLLEYHGEEGDQAQPGLDPQQQNPEQIQQPAPELPRAR